MIRAVLLEQEGSSMRQYYGRLALGFTLSGLFGCGGSLNAVFDDDVRMCREGCLSYFTPGDRRMDACVKQCDQNPKKAAPAQPVATDRK